MNQSHKQIWDFNDPDLVSALDETPLWSAPFGQVLLDTVILKPNLNVLDIGCGLGYPMLELAQRLGKSSRVTGLDPWQDGTNRLTFKMQQYGITNVTVTHGIAEDMPFADGTFDLITSNNGLNNVTDLKRAWQECFRVAKPGTQVVITENLPDTMIEFYTVYKEVLKEMGLTDCIKAMRDQIYNQRKPLAETQQLITDVGFAIKSIKQQSFSLRTLDGTTLLNHFMIRRAFLDGFKSILKTKDQRPVFQTLETRLNAIAHQNGELKLTIPFVCININKP